MAVTLVTATVGGPTGALREKRILKLYISMLLVKLTISKSTEVSDRDRSTANSGEGTDHTCVVSISLDFSKCYTGTRHLNSDG